MRILACWTLAFLCSVGLCASAQELPEAAAARARAAAVCVRTPKGAGARAGSGFLIRKDTAGGIVLTESWCVGAAGLVDVVFRIGQPDEKVVRGAVIAVDPSRSLATIRIPGDDLPEVLPMGSKTELKETEGVYVAGHPGVDTGAATSLRFLRCAVSSIRRDAQNQIAAIQLAGDVSIGDTGAALLDKTGRGVGVTVGKIPGTQTAFAITLEDILGFTAGDWVEIVFTTSAVSDTSAKLEISVSILNPVGAVRSMTIAWGRRDRCTRPNDPPPASKDGTWAKCWPLAKETTLRISEGSAQASVDLERLKAEADTDLVLQFKIGDGSKSRWLEPRTATVQFTEGKAVHYPNPRKGRMVSPPDATPPPPKLPPLVTGESCREVARLNLQSLLGDLCLSADGKDLIVLDRCAGKILRVDPSNLAVRAEALAHRGVSAIAVTPDWKSLWVASEMLMQAEQPNRAPEFRGVAQRFRLPGLESDPPIDLPCSPADLVATDSGLLVICSADSSRIFLFDTARRQLIGEGAGGRSLALGGSQRSAYFIGGARGGPACLPVGPIPKGESPGWSYLGPGTGPAEDLALSSDGQWVVLSNGFAAVLTGTKAGDFQDHYTFEPGLAVCVAPGTSTFFQSTDKGVLREYDLGEFKVKRESQVGVLLRDMRVDSATRRLYAIVTPIDPAASADPGKRSLADLVAYSLGDK